MNKIILSLEWLVILALGFIAIMGDAVQSLMALIGMLVVIFAIIIQDMTGQFNNNDKEEEE